MTIRLYGVDCFELKINNVSDARRVRAQRRYFGITEYGTTAESVALAKEFGRLGRDLAFDFMSQPFTVYTAYADARGGSKYKRYYGFILNQAGEDLAATLVKAGLARAYGVTRSAYDEKSQNDYRDWLRDFELQAAKRGKGAWAKTDWEQLPKERQLQREEDREILIAFGDQLPQKASIDLNTASRDELMSLPGIGETLALRIIESRPYQQLGDLSRVEGIGAKTLDNIKPFLVLN